MKITVYELRVKAYMYQNITSEDCTYKIAKLIDTVLANDNDLKSFHEENRYKNYVFGGLAPCESDKLYKKNKIYNFQLRTVDDKLVNYLAKNLDHFYNEDMNVLTVEIKIIQQKYINKLYSLTPVILKDYCNDAEKRGYWKNNFSVDFFERRIFENLIKKFNFLTGERLDENFQMFTDIQFNNQKPIAFNYKNIKLLGDKVDLVIDNNETAQLLVYFALGVGIGECNARGAGFVNYKGL